MELPGIFYPSPDQGEEANLLEVIFVCESPSNKAAMTSRTNHHDVECTCYIHTRKYASVSRPEMESGNQRHGRSKRAYFRLWDQNWSPETGRLVLLVMLYQLFTACSQPLFSTSVHTGLVIGVSGNDFKSVGLY